MGCICESCLNQQKEDQPQQVKQMQLKEVKQGLRKSLVQLQQQTKKVNQDKALLLNQIKLLQERINDLKGRINQAHPRVQKLKKKINQKQSQIGTTKYLIQKLDTQIRSISIDRQRICNQIASLEENRPSKFVSNIEHLQDKFKSIQFASHQLEKRHFQLQSQMRLRVRDHNNRLALQHQLQQETKQLELKLFNARAEASNSEQPINQLLAKQKQFSRMLTAVEYEDGQLTKNIRHLHKQCQQKQMEGKTKRQPSEVKSNEVPCVRNLKAFFVGEVLDNDQDYRQFLLNTLEQRLNSTITGTRLLYRWDPLNKVNLHRYIDDQEQLVIIIRLINGYVLAGWSEGPFNPLIPSEKDGLIISLTNRKFYQPSKQNYRSISYDEFFLIFGNSQLRIRTQESKIFSNFGVNNGYYKSNGDKVEVLLGSGSSRQVELVGYEVFQLKFT